MRRRGRVMALGVGWALGASGCDRGQTDIGVFPVTYSDPGIMLPEGGQLRYEHAELLGMPPQTFAFAEQFTAPAAPGFVVPTAPAGGIGAFGPCIDERGAPTWPFDRVTDPTYHPLPRAVVTGPGVADGLVLPLDPHPDPATAITYGGRAFQTVLPAAMSTPDADYAFDLGEGAPIPFHTPPAYDAPLGLGGAAVVPLPATGDLAVTWSPGANDFGLDGTTHTTRSHFSFLRFVDPIASQDLFLCVPDIGTDGELTIPRTVLDALPGAGLMEIASYTFWLEPRTATGEAAPARFDVIAMDEKVSQFAKP